MPPHQVIKIVAKMVSEETATGDVDLFVDVDVETFRMKQVLPMDVDVDQDHNTVVDVELATLVGNLVIGHGNAQMPPKDTIEVDHGVEDVHPEGPLL